MVPLFLHHVLMQILSPFFAHFPIVHVLGEVQGIPSINAYCNHILGKLQPLVLSKIIFHHWLLCKSNIFIIILR
jgi:hypothetical protein